MPRADDRIRSRRNPALARLIITATICCAASPGVANAADHPLLLWFDRPAENWEQEILPIGNGAMGAAVQGGVLRDRLQFNEKSLWTGGPGSADGYDFGLPSEPVTGELSRVRALLEENGALPPETVAGRLGRPDSGSAYRVSLATNQSVR